MAAERIIDGLWRAPVGGVNVYLLDGGDGLVLIDAGFPDKQQVVLDAVAAVGRKPTDLRNIVLTHAHHDHIGGLAALKAATGARAWMSAIDAPIAEAGGPSRPLVPAEGILRKVLFRVFVKPGVRVPPATIEHRVADGDRLPLAGGLRAIAAPGHCAGQMAYLWEGRRVLFAGDACMNVLGLGPPIGWENPALGRESLRKLAALDYDVACFGHGPPLKPDAAARMRKRWA